MKRGESLRLSYYITASFFCYGVAACFTGGGSQNGFDDATVGYEAFPPWVTPATAARLAVWEMLEY